MKRFIVVGVLIAALAGCQTIGAVSKVTQTISQIQHAVKAACAFVPTASTIAALIGKHLPYADIISSVCVAVGATGGDGSAPTYKVKGVTIHGHFVK